MKFESDSHYIDRVLNNDISAFAMLVEKHKDMVFTVALRILKNREDAEEIAQDAFVKVYQSLGTFKNESKFSTWLYRIVFNASVSKTRKRKLETTGIDTKIVENYSVDDIIGESDKLSHDEQKKLIGKILETLDPEDSALIQLFYYQECSTEEIGTIMNLTQANVKVRLHRLRKRLFFEANRLLNKEMEEIYL